MRTVIDWLEHRTGIESAVKNFLYEEICRRFCLVDSNDPDVMDFQKEAKKYGIPQQFLNVELWDVAPEIPSGAGNPTLEMAKNQMLMQYRSLYPPPAQQEILQRFTIQNTDPRTAERWVPLGKPAVTDAQTDAENKFGTLMQGVPVNAKPEFSPIEQVEVLLVLMGKKCDDIEKTGNITDENTLLGLTTVSAFTKQLVGRVAQDPQEKQLARKFSDVLGQIDNLIKGFTQRLAEQKKQQNSHADPKAIAQAQATMLQAKTKQKVTAVGAAQKMMQKKAAFAAEQKRKDAATALEERRKTIRTIGDEKRKNLSTIAETQRSRIKALREGGSE